MAVALVVAGNRILASDINQFYNLLKGVAASGESVTLIYNAAASLIFQPSSDPAAGTEVIQVKNNAGTVQGSLTYDGKVKVADGTAALPSLRLQSEATGFYRSSAGVLGVSASGAAANILFAAGTISLGANPATDGNINVANNTLVSGRNALNTQNIAMLYLFTDNKIYVGSAANDSGTVVRSAVDVWLSPAGNVDYRQSATALGGGAAPTLGTIGGSGPGTAGQNSWLQVKINGTNSWLPVWR